MDKPSINWCRILTDSATIHTIPVWVVIISPSTTARRRAAAKARFSQSGSGCGWGRWRRLDM